MEQKLEIIIRSKTEFEPLKPKELFITIDNAVRRINRFINRTDIEVHLRTKSKEQEGFEGVMSATGITGAEKESIKRFNNDSN
ncbi:MAG TPA: hypothetical protein PLR97_07980 [Bacilli bacterium]|jgi:hypothetical protein|nr:hypothetical protein [Bacilli bacterium]